MGHSTALHHLYIPSKKKTFALSSSFSVTNGTRQGCPLSPLLFALCDESLAASIRRNLDIRGILVRGKEFKLSLFADDIILTFTQPRISLPKLHAELDTYRFLSGYKINAAKSEALTINIPADEVHHLQTFFSYNWKTSALKNLGIHITPTLTTLYQADFPPLFRSIR